MYQIAELNKVTGKITPVLKKGIVIKCETILECDSVIKELIRMDKRLGLYTKVTSYVAIMEED